MDLHEIRITYSFSCRIALEEQSFSRLSYCKLWYYRPIEDYDLQECDVVWFVQRYGRQQFAPKPWPL